MIVAKLFLLLIAFIANFKDKKLFAFTVIIAIDVFAPIPTNEGRFVWCMDCILIDALTAVISLLFCLEVSAAICGYCVLLVIMHIAYLEQGFAKFPDYTTIVPAVECLMLILCSLCKIKCRASDVNLSIKKFIASIFLSTKIVVKTYFNPKFKYKAR